MKLPNERHVLAIHVYVHPGNLSLHSTEQFLLRASRKGLLFMFDLEAFDVTVLKFVCILKERRVYGRTGYEYHF